MRTWYSIILIPLAVATAGAQEVTIDPGMSRAQVEERLGRPLSARSAGEHIYLFFANGCERSCGMQDLVILRGDAVVDAVFRAPNRRYTGASSSPAGVKPEPTLGPIQVAPPSEPPARTGGVITAPPPDTTANAGPTGPTPRVVSPPSAGPDTAAGAAQKSTLGPGGVPLNPRDSITTSQPPTERGTMVPATPKSNPVPFGGSKPNPTDSAARAKAAKPDTTQKP